MKEKTAYIIKSFIDEMKKDIVGWTEEAIGI